MQPFDALTMRAILTEAKPILLNRRVEKIQQISRDEVVLSLRSKVGTIHLMVSAQASFGRLCLVLTPPQPRSANPPPFCQLLRKHLTSASMVGMEQLPGERIVDLIFSCVDEIGNRFTRVLTAEIMGRHSNLILWDRDSHKILGASHNVTQEMSRQREVAPGLMYARPPRQEKVSIFSVEESEFKTIFAELKGNISESVEPEAHLGMKDSGKEAGEPRALQGLKEAGEPPALPGQDSDKEVGGKQALPGKGDRNREGYESRHGRAEKDSAKDGGIRTFEQWLMANFAGLGRHLAEEIVEAVRLPKIATVDQVSEENAELLWQRIKTMQGFANHQPSMKADLSRFSVLAWWKEAPESEHSLWQSFPSVNDLVDAYFRGVQLRTEIQQLKDRIRSELKTEQDKLESRLNAAEKLLSTSKDLERFKQCGDMILAHVNEIHLGQTNLDCPDLYSENGNTATIELNPNLTGSQNAQHYYRLYAKSRIRSKTALVSKDDAAKRLADVNACSLELDKADNMQDLQLLKERVLDRGKKSEAPRPQSSPQPQHQKEKNAHQRLMSTKSTDGFTIIVGRNRQENDLLVTKLTQAHDIWMHAQGLEGAHVVVKLPNRKDPPQTTLKEAAQLAARFSRTGLGGKIKVAYTYGKYVHKLGKDKPGLVRYENEKTLEVDTTAPMPPSLRRLFS